MKPETRETERAQGPIGPAMPTQIILDHCNPSPVKWRFETHCYNPPGCQRYKPGRPYHDSGRRGDMVCIDDDIERAAQEDRGRLSEV